MRNRTLRILVIVMIAISIVMFFLGCIKPPKKIDSIQNEEWKIVKQDTAFQIIQIERILLPDSINIFRYKDPKTNVVYYKDISNKFNTYIREVNTFNTIGLNGSTKNKVDFLALSKAYHYRDISKSFISKNKDRLHIFCSLD